MLTSPRGPNRVSPPHSLGPLSPAPSPRGSRRSRPRPGVDRSTRSMTSTLSWPATSGYSPRAFEPRAGPLPGGSGPQTRCLVRCDRTRAGRSAGKLTAMHDAWWAAACKAHGDTHLAEGRPNRPSTPRSTRPAECCGCRPSAPSSPTWPRKRPPSSGHIWGSWPSVTTAPGAAPNGGSRPPRSRGHVAPGVAVPLSYQVVRTCVARTARSDRT